MWLFSHKGWRTAAMGLLGWGLAASSQAVPPQTVPNTIAQRAVACAACHGREGRASQDGYLPRIAGKPAGYLHHQLVNFKDGRRHNAAMVGLVDTLSSAYLREIAEYFAGLDLPYPPPQPLATGERLEPRALARGEHLVRQGDAALKLPACNHCHGSNLMGRQPATPGLLALPRDYLLGQIGAWRTGERRAHAPDCMAEVAKRLSPVDVAAVALWLSLQPVPAGAKPEPALPPSAKPAVGEALSCGAVQAAAAGPAGTPGHGGAK